MQNELWIIGNGFDIEHGLPTSYEDFYNFMDLIEKIKKITNEKIKNPKLNYDEIVRQNSEYYKCDTVYDVIKKSHFVKNKNYTSPIITKLKSYLLKASKKNKIYRYDIDLKYCSYLKFKDNVDLFTKLFDDDICLYRKLTYEPDNSKEEGEDKDKVNYRKKGIEGALIYLINNTNELDEIKYAPIQLYLIQQGFSYYIKDVVFDIIFKESYTNMCKYKIINRIDEFKDNISNIKGILNFNYTHYFRLYSDKMLERSFPINGEIKYIGGIFGINIDEVEKDKKEKFKGLSKNNMRLLTYNIYTKLYNIRIEKLKSEEEKAKLKEEKKLILNNIGFSMFDENGSFKYKKYLNCLKDVNRIRIYGHSLAIADQDVLKPLLKDSRIQSVIVYIYNGENKQELLDTNVGKNLIKMLYGVDDYRKLREEEFNEFKEKFELIELGKEDDGEESKTKEREEEKKEKYKRITSIITDSHTIDYYRRLFDYQQAAYQENNENFKTINEAINECILNVIDKE